MFLIISSLLISKDREINGKRKTENGKLLVFRFSLGVGKRTAAIKPRAEAACRLCRGEAVKSPRSGIKTENGKLYGF